MIFTLTGECRKEGLTDQREIIQLSRIRQSAKCRQHFFEAINILTSGLDRWSRVFWFGDFRQGSVIKGLLILSLWIYTKLVNWIQPFSSLNPFFLEGRIWIRLNLQLDDKWKAFSVVQDLIAGFRSSSICQQRPSFLIGNNYTHPYFSVNDGTLSCLHTLNGQPGSN